MAVQTASTEGLFLSQLNTNSLGLFPEYGIITTEAEQTIWLIASLLSPSI